MLTSKDQDQGLFDPWTLVHIAFGVSAGMLKINPWLYGVGIVLYEVVENFNQGSFNKKIFGASGPECQINSVMDIAVGLAGYAVARRLKEK